MQEQPFKVTVATMGNPRFKLPGSIYPCVHGGGGEGNKHCVRHTDLLDSYALNPGAAVPMLVLSLCDGTELFLVLAVGDQWVRKLL